MRKRARAPKHYVYRMDHDTGFAPHVGRGVCTLCGCKTTTVEAWARPGSWVVGIGGKGTGKRDALIYALKVEANPTVEEFRRRWPRAAAYLVGRSMRPSSKVLVARHFYYLGDHASLLPSTLRHMIIRTQGAKKVTDEDVAGLDAYLAHRFGPGAHGCPNNPERKSRNGCGCGRANNAVQRSSGSRGSPCGR